MKKYFSLALAGVLALAGCGSTTEPATSVETSKPEVAEKVDEAVAATEGTYKLGIGAAEYNETSDFKDEDHLGKLSLSTTVATVAVDENDIIQYVNLDAYKVDNKFDAEGKLNEDVEETTDLKSKKDLGDDYGMKVASEIGKEWYEQAEAFEQFAIGKNINDLIAGSLNEDEDLKTSCTIDVNGFVYAIANAYESAVEYNGTLDSLEVIAEPTYSATSATADTEGSMGLFVAYRVLNNGEDITAGTDDAFVKFTNNGTIVEEAEAE